MSEKEKELDVEIEVEETVEVDEVQKKIETLEKEVMLWKEKAYRTIADCDNLRKSYEKDHRYFRHPR